MKKALRILVIFSYSTFATALNAQETERYYLEQQSLKYRDGIYTNIAMVKKNIPIPSTWIETDMEVNNRDFYKHITRADEIIFFDDNGVRSVLNTKRIWGYCHNGDLHINVGGAFHEIDIVGRISHFIALKTTYDPFFYTDEYPPGLYYITPPVMTVRNREYLVDIVNNKAWEFDLDGLEQVLKKDPQLWDEFRASSKREKEFLKYIYLNRYNKKYPIDIHSN